MWAWVVLAVVSAFLLGWAWGQVRADGKQRRMDREYFRRKYFT
jgi:hypothetical protein